MKMKVPFTLGVVGHFGLAVRNPKKSARWFERVLGLRKQFEFDGGVAIGNDNVTIALFKGKPAPKTFEHMSFHLPNMSILRKARTVPISPKWKEAARRAAVARCYALISARFPITRPK